MNRLTVTLLFILLTLNLSAQMPIEDFNFDGTDNLNFTIDPRDKDCDSNTGTFGLNAGNFEIRDVEGLNCCPCAFNGALQECGDNSSMASSDPIDLTGWCNVSVRVSVSTSNAVFECNDQSFPTTFCNPQFDPGRDAMKIEVLLPSLGSLVEIGSYCGDNRIGSFELTGINEPLIQIIITGGTEAIDEAYFIENIIIEGFPSSISPPRIEEASNLTNVCVGDNFSLTAITTLSSSTFQWALDGVIIPGATNQNYTVPIAATTDAGTYTVEVSNSGGTCAVQTATYSMSVGVCTVPPATFVNLATSFCRDTDQLNLPLSSQESYTGTWNVNPNLVLNTVPIFNTLIFTPDPSFGADEFIQNIRLDTIPIFGDFADLPYCTYDELGQAINLLFELSLRANDIAEVNVFGLSYFPPNVNDISSISLNSVTEGTYPISIQSIPFGRCGQQDTMVNLTINKIDRVGDQTLIHCAQDANTQDFNNLIGVDRIGGIWADLDGTGIDLNINPTATDLSGLAPGSYQFRYEGPGANISVCAGLEGSAVVTVDVVAGASSNTGTFDPGVSLCEGDGSSFPIGGMIFNETNTTDNVLLPGMAANGCDSLVIVNLIYNPTRTSEIREADLCEGDGFFVDVNGRRYDETNRFGTEILTSSTGCDSVVTIDLIFNPAPTRTESPPGLCQGDPFSVTYAGTIYNQGNPSGVETVPSNGTGCDSVITIDLVFAAPAVGTESHLGCVGDGHQVTVNGTLYNEANPSGTETINGGAANGCDSVVTIIFTFGPLISKTLNPSGLCIGSTFNISFNGTTYNEGNPSGTEIIPSTTTGCDTLLSIDLSFNQLATGSETYDGCSGDTYDVSVNGVNYNEVNPSGTETLVGAAFNGCDSVVSIDLQFKTVLPGQESYLGKEGDGYDVVVNGITYNEQNPNGIDTLIAGAANGCDSVVTTTLIFVQGRVGEELYTGCTGDGYEVTVGLSTYNEASPSGIDSLLTPDGIDSIVSTMLTFNNPVVNQVDQTHTNGSGFSITLNNVIYDESNPSGLDTIPNAAANGCDSIIIVNLNFASAIIAPFDTTLCFGDPYTRQGSFFVYSESNPVGTDTYTTSLGIDSIVTTTLTFVGPSEENINESRCSGDGFEVVGWNRTFDEANPSGRDTLVGGDQNGCDSIIIVNLIFNSNVIVSNDIDLCLGETEIVGNSVYGAGNLMGTDTIFTGTGCDTIIMTTVTLDSIEVDIAPMASCANEDNGSLILTNLVSNTTLSVNVDGQDYMLTDILMVSDLASGSYNIELSNMNGCMIDEPAVIDMLPLSNLSIDTTDIGTDSLMLDFIFDGTVADVMWSANTGVVCSTCMSINITTLVDNVYTVMVTDDAGCMYSASLTVGAPPVVVPSGPREFYMSNAIVANGISGNQTLFLQTGEIEIETYNLAVYSRWGSKVFDAQGLLPNDPSRGWNALIAGDQVASGVYVYRLELFYADGTSEVVGGDVLFLK